MIPRAPRRRQPQQRARKRKGARARHGLRAPCQRVRSGLVYVGARLPRACFAYSPVWPKTPGVYCILMISHYLLRMWMLMGGRCELKISAPCREILWKTFQEMLDWSILVQLYVRQRITALIMSRLLYRTFMNARTLYNSLSWSPAPCVGVRHENHDHLVAARVASCVIESCKQLLRTDYQKFTKSQSSKHQPPAARSNECSEGGFCPGLLGWGWVAHDNKQKTVVLWKQIRCIRNITLKGRLQDSSRNLNARRQYGNGVDAAGFHGHTRG